MKVLITTERGEKQVDLSKPIGIHIPIENGKGVCAWYAAPASISPAHQGNFVGSIEKGAAVNFNDISFNPHAHGTHTECVGHILAGNYTVLDSLNQYFFESLLVTVAPVFTREDLVITKEILVAAIGDKDVPQALIIRTLPNEVSKLLKQYSHSNPAYLSEQAAIYIKELGVSHLFIDLPSIDKEFDGGAILAHKAFWNVGGTLRIHATITEFVFVPDTILDNYYFLQLGLAPFVNDASPSTVLLYPFENK
jgi:arylformamidase